MLLRNRLCTASRPTTRPAQRRGVVARAATKQRVSAEMQQLSLCKALHVFHQV